MVKINGVLITSNVPLERDESVLYVDYVLERQPDACKIHVTMNDDDTVDLDWTAYHTKFERIRRITGYLVGTLDRWNNSKLAEEHDRVKHVGGNQ